MPSRIFRPPIAAHRGLLVLRCAACRHAWVSDWVPLSSGCPLCHGPAEPMFRAGCRVHRRFPRKIATDLARMVREGDIDGAFDEIRKLEAGRGRFVEGRR